MTENKDKQVGRTGEVKETQQQIARKQRLKKSLRANLQRRKAKKRALKSSGDTPLDDTSS
ncbi:MAG: hypothetical protein GKR97_11210 [Rhizobiaceae bacterium]|nr:hypothetical protein [Rhizobiaceae bacterium]